MLGLDKLCFRNHPGDTIDFLFLILTKDDTNFEMISVYLVFLQLGIMVLTIIPTEFLLHKHFTKQGMKKIANFQLAKMKIEIWRIELCGMN